MVLHRRLAPPLTLLIWLASATSAQATRESDPLFCSDTMLPVRIFSTLDVIVEGRPNDEYVPGTLSHITDNGTTVEFESGIGTRGNVRRREDICLFPPLRLNFKKKGEGRGKIKLVAHRNPSSYIYEQAVVSEHLTFRNLNLFTFFSFRGRLLKAEYPHSPEDDGSNARSCVADCDEMGVSKWPALTWDLSPVLLSCCSRRPVTHKTKVL